MKNILFLSMFAVIVALTSCNKQENLIIVDDGTPITFTLDKDVLETRTGGSNRYIIEVYEGADVSGESVKRVVQEDNTSFIISLEKDKEYVCLFWADDNANETYDVSSLKDVTLNSGKEISEAFFASKMVSTAETHTHTITLKRAVAKVNLIEKGRVAANTDLKVTFNRYTQFNVFSGEVAGESASFSKTFKSEATTDTLGTLLTFASVSGITTDFSFLYGTEAEKGINHVALKANFITNISGKFSSETTLTFIMTEDGDWSAEEINIPNEMFPDVNFKAYVLGSFDINRDGEISIGEASLVDTIKCHGIKITSLEGIEHFTNVTFLSCGYNDLTSLDVSKNTKLKTLWCMWNQLRTLDVTTNTELTELVCFRNHLNSLDVTTNTKLIMLKCGENNQLNRLDVSLNTKLEKLDCSGSPLGSLSLTTNTELTELFCNTNQLTVLDLSKNTKLKTLECNDNLLKTLDVSKNIALTALACKPMPTLTDLIVKRGTNTSTWSVPSETVITQSGTTEGDNDPLATKIITSIIQTNFYNNIETEYTFTYNDNEQLLSLSSSIGHGSTRIEYQNNKIIITGYEVINEYDLNSEGMLVAMDDGAYTWTYNNEGYLTERKESNGSTVAFVWENKNLQKATWFNFHDSETTFLYSAGYVNNTNLDLNVFLSSMNFGSVYGGIINTPALFRKIGKSSMNITEKMIERMSGMADEVAWWEETEYNYAYEFDDDGFPKKITVNSIRRYSQNNEETPGSMITYTIQYKN